MDILQGEINSGLKSAKPKKEQRFRGYCESCGTMGLHGRRCVSCGFNFDASDESVAASRTLPIVRSRRENHAAIDAFRS